MSFFFYVHKVKKRKLGFQKYLQTFNAIKFVNNIKIYY